MAESAAHLVDHVFPDVPVRQWVISFSWRLRYLLGLDVDLCRRVRRLFLRAVFGSYSSKARLTRSLIWTDVARKAEGNVFRVDQDGGAIAIATPFDNQLATLSAEIDGTRMWYGNREELTVQKSKDQSARKIYAQSSEASQAARCEFNRQAAGFSNWIVAAKELIHDLGNGKLKLADIAEDELSEALKKIEVGKRQQHIDRVVEKRGRLENTIEELLSERRVFLEQTLAKEAKGGQLTWGLALRKCVQGQIGRYRVRLESNPSVPVAKPTAKAKTSPL